MSSGSAGIAEQIVNGGTRDAECIGDMLGGIACGKEIAGIKSGHQRDAVIAIERFQGQLLFLQEVEV